MKRPLLLLAMLVGLAGCGQKGPLYFRDNPPPGYKAPKTDTYKPTPYPKDMPTDADGSGATKK